LIFRKFFIYQFFLIFFTCTSASSAEKIVYLDIDFILNKSKPGISILKNIDKIREKETAKLKSIEKKLQKQNEDIVKSKNLLSKDELKLKIDDLKKEIKIFDNKKRDIASKLNEKRQLELNNFIKKINPIVQNYMDENSIDIIVDKKNIFIAKSEFDITKEILDLVNKKIK
tara:strand:+ start:787 stop:1299 length:513 start_codon:yes stop_codon:yes gene_type:complete